MTGTVYTVPPIPPDAESTTYVDAGAIRIGIEYRRLDAAELGRNYAGGAMDEIQEALDGQTVEDNGVSLHVGGTDDGHEYLRFDLFAKEPHYHYIEPSGEKQTIVDYDRVAMGPMLSWALVQIRDRLPEMLAFAGGADLVPKLEPGRIEASLAEVERLARRAEAALAADLADPHS